MVGKISATGGGGWLGWGGGVVGRRISNLGLLVQQA